MAGNIKETAAIDHTTYTHSITVKYPHSLGDIRKKTEFIDGKEQVQIIATCCFHVT